MSTGIRQNNIRHIISLEDRIAQCRRCHSLLRCTARPVLGKGDLDPDLIMVFESDSSFTRDTEKILRLRKIINNEFNCDKIYHTFMIRCKAKACTHRNNMEIYSNSKLLNMDDICLLTGKKCDAVLVKASDEAALFCLPYLIEEITILNPRIVILFGSRVSEFVLKSYGIYDAEESRAVYKYKDIVFLKTSDEFNFDIEECRLLSVLS